MIRDLDLVRGLLVEVEQSRNISDLNHKFKSLNESELGHLKLLIDANFVDGMKVVTCVNGDDIFVPGMKPRLTMQGHDFLESLRPPKL